MEKRYLSETVQDMHTVTTDDRYQTACILSNSEIFLKVVSSLSEPNFSMNITCTSCDVINYLQKRL